ncbi:hypothetical protein HFP15_18820 [Amycolatopsis sp. K13G38]|uniref:PH domain-containing protein n=1 Tax=Amycolatopsis acididurans TaxID=2724524 RepID=A0ABX1J9D3_9PSEU|nr:hypothetical protein [Amycolatopsis acididurans]NKQ54940.1 hypothetical protein [Amycolatopsis acididurans]
MTRFRLGRQAKLDQVAVAINLVIIGAGLVLLGSVMDWSGWLTVPMIVLGVLFLLITALRLAGWRNLVWSRELVVDAEGVRCESRGGDGFAVRWSDLAALGVHTDEGVDPRFGLTLICYPKAPELPGSGTLVPLRDNAGRMARLRRRPGIAEAIRDGAPGDWQRPAATGWDVLVAAPEIAPRVIPQPAPGRPVVVNTGLASARQAFVGGALAAFFGIVALVGAFSAGAPAGMRVAAGIIGVPFLLVALAIVASVPMLARSRHVVLDPYALMWSDPGGQSRILPWDSISSITTQSTVVRGSALSNSRTTAHLVVHAKDGNLDLALGAQLRSAERIAEAVQLFAPRLWHGASSRTGRFGIK